MVLLKEFDFDSPQEGRGRRKLFRLQTRCVTALYERLFPGFKTSNCWKVLLECVSNLTREQYRDHSGVYVLEVVANIENFFLLSDTAKKEWALETLQAGVNILLDQTGWPNEPFLETYRQAKQLELLNHWVWKKPISSPSRKFTAEVLIEHEVQFCNINIIVRDHNGQEIKRETLISEIPDEWAYARHLGILTWESETEIALRNKEGNKSWLLDL